VELFDRVNERDEVIGVTDKLTSHREGHIHRIVEVYVFAPDGRMYMQLHKKSGMLDTTVGGHVAQSESYDIAAVRETEEEIGLTQPLQPLKTYYGDERIWKGSHTLHYRGMYECTPSSDWKFEPNDEVEVVELATLEAIVERMNAEPKQFTPGFLLSMREYIALKQLPYRVNVPELFSLSG
jgi:isopentenyldiphosphate isomerase